MKFKYQARTKGGDSQSGIIEASSREAAQGILQKYDLYITSLEEIKPPSTLFKEIKIFHGVSKKEVVIFSRQLATMLESRVPPSDALQALADQTRNLDFRKQIYKMTNDIRGGSSLSKALAFSPNVFSSFYVNMVKSGEISGSLPGVLNRLAEHLEREYHLRSKIIGAMIYPVVVIIVFILIFLLLMLFIIPSLTDVLIAAGQELPLMTKIVIGISDFLKKFWFMLPIVFIIMPIALAYYRKTKEGREVFDRAFLKAPLAGGFLQNVQLARFAENLSALISAGIPIAQSLEITSKIAGNAIYEHIIVQVKDRVMRGESISATLKEFPDYIPPLFIQMTAVGERTGRLDNSLLSIVDFYQKEIDIFVDTLTSLIEPILIIGLALMVGVLAASVFLPLYQIGGAMY